MEKQLILRKIMDESGYLVVQESKEVLQNSFKKKRKKKKKKQKGRRGKNQKTPKSWLLLYINGI